MRDLLSFRYCVPVQLTAAAAVVAYKAGAPILWRQSALGNPHKHL